MKRKMLAIVLSILFTVLLCFAANAEEQAAYLERAEETPILESADEEMLLRDSFLMNLVQFFTDVRLDREAVKLSVARGGEELINGSIQYQGDLLSISFQEIDIPFELQIGSDAMWLNYMGNVYEVRLEDIAEIVQQTQPKNTEVWPEMLRLFAEDVLLPGISTESQGSTLIIRANYTAESLIAGAVKFADTVVASDSYLDAVLSVLDVYGQLADETIPNREQVRAMWPSAKEMMLASSSDLVISFEGKIDPETIAGDVKIATNGEEGTISFEAANSSEMIVVRAKVTDPEMEYLNLDFTCQKKLGTFKGSLTIPMNGEEYSLSGAYDLKGSVLQCEAEHVSRRRKTQRVRLLCEASRDSFSGRLIYNARPVMTVADLFIEPNGFKIAVNNSGRRFGIEADWDRTGNYHGKFEMPDGYTGAEISGYLRRGEFHTEGTLNAYGISRKIALDYSAAKKHIGAEVGTNGQTITVTHDWAADGSFTSQIKSPDKKIPGIVTALNASGKIEDESLKLKCDYISRGTRIGTLDAKAEKADEAWFVFATLNLFKARQTYAMQIVAKEKDIQLGIQSADKDIDASLSEDGTLAYSEKDSHFTRTVEGRFESETRYLVDSVFGINIGETSELRAPRKAAQVASASDSSQAPEATAAPERTTTQAPKARHRYYQLAIEEGKRLVCDGKTEDAGQMFSVVLERGLEPAIKPLSEESPMRVDMEFVKELLEEMF